MAQGLPVGTRCLRHLQTPARVEGAAALENPVPCLQQLFQSANFCFCFVLLFRLRLNSDTGVCGASAHAHTELPRQPELGHC